MRYKMFCVGLICCVLFLLITTALLNFQVDSLGIFNRQNSPIVQYAKAINEGYTLINFSNINDRILQKNIIQTQQAIPSIIAIGSSRIMGLKSSTLQSKDFFNHGMSGAGIKDYLGIIGGYLSKNQLPQVIIFGLDPWIFNQKTDFRFLDLQNEIQIFYQAIHQKYSPQEQSFKIKELLALDNTLQNLSFIFSANSKILIGKNCQTSSSCIDTDGSQTPPQHILESQQNIVLQEAKAYTRKPVYQLEKYNKLHTEEFLNLMHFLQKQNIQIIFFLPPYHPFVYNFLKNNPKYSKVFEAQKFIEHFAKLHHIAIIGHYNPSKLSLNEDAFTDGMHLKPKYVNQIFQKFFSNTKDFNLAIPLSTQTPL